MKCEQVKAKRAVSIFGLRWPELTALVYLGFWFIVPLAESSVRNWILLGIALIVFMVLFVLVNGERFRLPIRRTAAAAMTVMALVYVPLNLSAFGIYIYIAASLPEIMPAPVTYNVALSGVVAIILGQAWYEHFPSWEWSIAVGISVLTSLNVRYYLTRRKADARLRMAHDEIEQLAKTAERERIARDLHDVLGHTLSLIAVKSELASRLLLSDTDRAATELAEIQSTARRALAEVRQTVSGYRARGLERELAQMAEMLTASGIMPTVMPAKPPALESQQEAMFCMVLREAVTNVVRHSRASSCAVEFRVKDDGGFELTVADNGHGGAFADGNGLAGMRERLAEFRGQLLLRSGREGTTLSAGIPRPAAASSLASGAVPASDFSGAAASSL